MGNMNWFESLLNDLTWQGTIVIVAVVAAVVAIVYITTRYE